MRKQERHLYRSSGQNTTPATAINHKDIPMEALLVTTDIIESPEAQAYFTKADRRVMIGFRATLEMLNIPVPTYAHRGYSGPTPAKAALAAFNADNPRPRSTVLAERRPNAAPERIAAANALKASGMGSPAHNVFPA